MKKSVLILLLIMCFCSGRANSPVPEDIVFVDGGTFDMGSSDREIGRDENEGPQHRVTVSSFYIGKYELTVGEYRSFIQHSGYVTSAELGANVWFWRGQWWSNKGQRSWKNPGFSQTDSAPVVCVSWYDAIAYCNWKSMKNGKTALYSYEGKGTDFLKWPSGWNIETHNLISLNRRDEGYRLPTEAEWEYTARGGNKTKGYLYAGTDNVNELDTYGEEWKTQPIGRKKGNELGLFDMSGNAWEWCQDWYQDYTAEAPTDPIGPVKNVTRWIRINRGGGWRFNNPANLRVANRGYDCSPTFVTIYSGFRLVLQPGTTSGN